MIATLLGFGERTAFAESVVEAGRVAAAGPVRAPTTSKSALIVATHGDELSRTVLRRRLASDLDRPILFREEAGAIASASSVITITWHKATHELAVTYDRPGKATVSRVVGPRDTAEEASQDAALLAVNLVGSDEDVTPPPPLPSPPATAPSGSEVAPRWTYEASARRVTKTPAVVLSAFYPLASNYDRPWERADFEANIGFGRVGSLEGFQIGVVNASLGWADRADGHVRGMQNAFLVNIASGHVRGVQAAGLVNIGRSIDGAQVSFFGGNIAPREVDGAQLSPFLNYTGGPSRAFQLAALNIAGDIQGAQLGLINIARTVKGAQIGAINIADDVDGVPFGPLSVTRTGGIHPTLWSATGSLVNVGLKFATRYTYTMVSAHYHSAAETDCDRPGCREGGAHLNFFGPGVTFGGHIPLGDSFFLEPDMGVQWMYAPRGTSIAQGDAVSSYNEHLVQPRLRVSAGYAFAPHASLYVGATALLQLHLVRRSEDVGRVQFGPEIFGGVAF